MRCIVKKFDHESRSDTFRIVPIGDCHLGNRAADEKLLQKTIDYVRETPNTFWIGMGDILDAIGRKDPRHHEETLASWCHGKNLIFKEQRERAIEMLKPIGDKCLAYLMGNHEEYLEASGIDLYYSVAEGIVNNDKVDVVMGMSGYLLLRFNRCGEKGGATSIRLYMHHGFGGGQLMGGKALKLERLPASHNADIYLMGHVHTKMAFAAMRDGIDRAGNIVDNYMLLACTGSFLSSAIQETTTYSERLGYKPQPAGTIEIELRPGATHSSERMRVVQ